MTAQTRRRFLAGFSLAGAAAIFRTAAIAAEERLETTSVLFMRTPSICHAPQFVIEDLLRAEGFTDIRHVDRDSSAEFNESLAQNQADFGTHYSAELLPAIESGSAITILSGVHVGCQELFVRDDIRSIIDLKGRSVAVPIPTSTQSVLVAALVARDRSAHIDQRQGGEPGRRQAAALRRRIGAAEGGEMQPDMVLQARP